VNAPRGISVVVPTVGRPSLGTLLAALHQSPRPPGVPVEILVVPDATGAGPAATRNRGWRQAAHEWVAFLDDDVVPDPAWLRRLAADLTVPPEVGGVQGQVRVPLPDDRRPTDWERVTAGLADSDWITADMAYRRAALERVGGFDERFPRAFREDAELAYRVRRAGWELRRGTRTVTHPVRAESRWVSLRTQRGNADDALLRRIYGPRWRDILDVPSGRRRRHAAVVAAGAATLGCAVMSAGTRRRRWRVAAGLAATAWLAGTTEFAVSRIRPGPRTRREISTMVLSSAIIPVIAITHWCRGWWRWRSVES
jgi:glycosyltransferase involved in cell wall biosynthesis